MKNVNIFVFYFAFPKFGEDVAEAGFVLESFGFKSVCLFEPEGIYFFVALYDFSVFFSSSFGFRTLFWLSSSFTFCVYGTCMTTSD